MEMYLIIIEVSLIVLLAFVYKIYRNIQSTIAALESQLDDKITVIRAYKEYLERMSHQS